MADDLREQVKKEIKALQALPQHKNLVQVHECSQAAYVKTRPNGKKEERTVDYIVHELGHGGELFDYLASTGGF